jgi:hypothetical protein
MKTCKQITINARRFQRPFIKIIKSNGHFIGSRAINPLRQWLVDAWPLISQAAQLRTSHFLHRHVFIDVFKRAPPDCRRHFLISDRSRGQIALLVTDNQPVRSKSFFFLTTSTRQKSSKLLRTILHTIGSVPGAARHSTRSKMGVT